MAERTFSRRQLVGLYPPFSQTLPIGILDGYRLVVADDHVDATLWWDDGPNDIFAIPISKTTAKELLALPETGAIPDNFVAKDGASPPEYLAANSRVVDELRRKPAICEEKPPVVPGAVWSNPPNQVKSTRPWWHQRDNFYPPGSRISYSAELDAFVYETGGGAQIFKRPSENWGHFKCSDVQVALPDSGDPLTAWPKCHVCNKPVDSYKAKRNDDGSVTVRSECHGKVNAETIYPADYTAGPLMMFEPGYDK